MVDEEGAKEPLDPTAAPGERISGAPSADARPRVSPLPPPRSDRPGRTTGPLLPMRIIGVNAAPATVAEPGGEGPAPAPSSSRPPPSIPPPKPISTRASKEPPPPTTEPITVDVEVDGVNEPEGAPETALAATAERIEEQLSLTPPWPPTDVGGLPEFPHQTVPMNELPDSGAELQALPAPPSLGEGSSRTEPLSEAEPLSQTELLTEAEPIAAEGDSLAEPVYYEPAVEPTLVDDVALVDEASPVVPPPLPAERRSNPSLGARSDSGETIGLPPPPAEPTSLPPMPAPPAPPLRSPRAADRVSEPPVNRAGFDAPTPPETPAVRAEVLAARAAQEAAAKAERSKPPALPTRGKKASGELDSSAGVDASEPQSQPPTGDGTARPKKRRPPPIPPPRSAFTGGSEEEAAKRKHWWEEVFGDDFLRAIIEPTQAQVAREVDFIEGSFNLEKPAAILDLACGAGRHSVELTRRGYTTVGYDLSVTQLARASESAQLIGAKVAFLHGDMREMGFEQMFDAVLCWNASFGYFEEEKNLSVLKNIHRALKPGGCLLLDIPNRDFIVAQQPAQNWFEGDGCVCMDDMHVDFITSRLCVKRTIMLDDGRNKECLYSIRLFGLHELGRMLHEIGFRVNEVTGHVATRGVYMGATSPRLIMLVTKR